MIPNDISPIIIVYDWLHLVALSSFYDTLLEIKTNFVFNCISLFQWLMIILYNCTNQIIYWNFVTFCIGRLYENSWYVWCIFNSFAPSRNIFMYRFDGYASYNKRENGYTRNAIANAYLWFVLCVITATINSSYQRRLLLLFCIVLLRFHIFIVTFTNAHHDILIYHIECIGLLLEWIASIVYNSVLVELYKRTKRNVSQVW